ncbi:MAG TPA: primosomal protein N' [Thermoanaerobaculia bacterium]|nr:primosomal protein N' [Thermoanaerobaculia bacterium]
MPETRVALADIALPLPLPDPLTYEVPDAWTPLAVPGVRARVLIGRRRLTGLIVRVHEDRPEGVSLRPLLEILDREPVVPADLLELARFTADYYMAPLGEVVRSMLPSDLPPWGDRKVWLTDAGALALPRSPSEAAVIAALREGGRMTVAELQSRVGALQDLDAVLAALAEGGRIHSEEHRARSARYVNAVELAPGEVSAHLAKAGRSAAGKAVIEYLAAIGRPATTAEVTAAVECTPAVVRRLVSLGVLRQFTQVERLSLDRHMLGAPEKLPEIRLRDDQAHALGRLTGVLDARAFAPLLLQGMTGSGKTEVYLRAAEEALARGRSTILLVPEIALVPALARAVERRFGDDLAILHSGLGVGERHQEWERVRRGEARVVLGPRSALFAPVADLGLIVVDEEQDTSYKQELSPRYNARDLALVRARDANAAALLVSATPSLESRYNAERGKLELLRLTERAGQGSLPEGILVDLKEEGVSRRPGEVHFSERLRFEIRKALADGDQVILLRNRRGYSPILLCRACGEDMRCEDCGLPRTYHRRDRRLVCHYCGSTLPAPKVCPNCKEDALEAIGAGTERVEEDFKELFPGVTVDVLDRDTARRPGGPAAVLERFARGEVQVLIGTQMVSKGHHFPNVALTAVLAADAYLSFPDFRAVERTYNLLVQVAGRAGRGEKPGRVVIQTYHPDHYAIQAALRGDDEGFAREELRFRRVFHYPPYTRMVQLLVRDKNRDRAWALISDLAADLAAHPLARAVRLSGPAPAPLERLRGEWRFQLLARSADGRGLHRMLEEVLPKNPAYDLVIDVDPQQLL